MTGAALARESDFAVSHEVFSGGLQALQTHLAAATDRTSRPTSSMR